MIHAPKSLTTSFCGVFEVYDTLAISGLGDLIWVLLKPLLWVKLRYGSLLAPKRPHKHEDLAPWFQGPIQGDKRNLGLQHPHVCVVFGGPSFAARMPK